MRLEVKAVRTQVDIGKFFNGSTPGAHVTFSTPDGKKLLEMQDWGMAVLNYKDGDAGLGRDRGPATPNSIK